ncbi:DNA polymerase zeta [Sorochytrium milnesiophthora]
MPHGDDGHGSSSAAQDTYVEQSSRQELLAVRIVYIDHVLVPPGPLDRKHSPFASNISTDAVRRVPSYIMSLGMTINNALTAASNKHDKTNAEQYLAGITLVKGVPLYGYHGRYQAYLKISLLDPNIQYRLLQLFESGAIMQTQFQPHESHLSFALQFMMDYNLYGMDYIRVDWGKFRMPVTPKRASDAENLLTNHNVPVALQWNEVKYPGTKRSTVDELKERPFDPSPQHIPSIHKRWREKDTKFVSSLASVWEDERARRQLRNLSLGSLRTEASPEEKPEDVRLPRSQWDIEDHLLGRIDDFLRSTEAAARSEQSAGGMGDEEALVDVPTAFAAVSALNPARARVQQVQPSSQIQRTDVDSQNEHHIDEEYHLRDFDDLVALTQHADAPNEPTFSQASLDFDLSVLDNIEQEAAQARNENFSGQPLFSEHGNDDELLDLLMQDDDAPYYKSFAVSDQEGAIALDENSNELTIQVADVIHHLTEFGDEELEQLLRYSQSDHSTAPSDGEDNALRIPQVDGAGDDDDDDDDHETQINRKPGKRRLVPKWRLWNTQPNLLRERPLSGTLPQQHSQEPKRLVPEIVIEAPIQAAVHTSEPKRKRMVFQDVCVPILKRARATVSSTQVDYSTSTPTPKVHFKLPASQPKAAVPLPKAAQQRTSFRLPAVPQSPAVAAQPALPMFSKSISALWSPTSAGKLRRPPSVQEPSEPSTPVPAASPSDSSTRISESPDAHALSSPLPIPDGQTSYSQHDRVRVQFAAPPPTVQDALDAMATNGIPLQQHRDAFYGKATESDRRTRTFAGREFKLAGDTVDDLPAFDVRRYHADVQQLAKMAPQQQTGRLHFIRSWTPARPPPTHTEALRSLSQHRLTAPAKLKSISQLESVTPKAKYGFKSSQSKLEDSVTRKQFISCLSLEAFATSRGSLQPDPASDAVEAVVYAARTEQGRVDFGRDTCGMIIVEGAEGERGARYGLGGCTVIRVASERELFSELVNLVREFDPDIIMGYEIHSASWGYCVERAGEAYDLDLPEELSRVRPTPSQRGTVKKQEDKWGYTRASALHVVGRIVLNVWRLMRAEFNLTSYTFEALAFHVLHQRYPHFTNRTLTQWYTAERQLLRWRVFKYLLDRSKTNILLLEQCDLLNRTCEFARLFGMDFYSVISRGSQFRVEAMMLRIAKPENYITISPSKKQVASQRAAECIPLIMEPESRFYPSPLLVLDFQSLYPSVMIAYNYCYTTCLGKVPNATLSDKLGVSKYDLDPQLLEQLRPYITVSPNGLMFVKPDVREGLLGRMLSELLDTRVMVKSSMKQYKSEKALLRLLDARQLGLKYIANVTYGYASASFSGRMPCVEIADSIVQTGRETLEKAINLINSTERWGAKVVYGDTDSVFVYVPGATLERAFQVGQEIAEEVTRRNPQPVKLKFEKVDVRRPSSAPELALTARLQVYHPCVLLTKKRYVGRKYEALTDTPEFEAKGIETVRRDGCPANGKLMRKCLDILFTTADLSQVKVYLQRQWAKILEGRVSVQDFIIAKEVRMGTYSEHGPPPPGALISAKRTKQDPRMAPQYAERVPYVVAYGNPGERLIDQVMTPHELVYDKGLRLNGTYYITRQIIPALERVFNLLGADLKTWFAQMTRTVKPSRFTSSQRQSRQGRATIDKYYVSTKCVVCGQQTTQEVCQRCLDDPGRTKYAFGLEYRHIERKYADLATLCHSCIGFRGGVEGAANDQAESDIACDSLDCPTFYDRLKAQQQLRVAGQYAHDLDIL